MGLAETDVGFLRADCARRARICAEFDEDAFMTFGMKHIKFWRKGSDILGGGTSLLWESRLPQWRGAKMTDVSCAAFLSAGFVVRGHPSGDLYLWKHCRVGHIVSLHPAVGGQGLCYM